jgi:penicillin-binding protein 2
LASNGTRGPSRRFLPPDPRVAEPYRLTPQLAFRIAILSTVVLVAFGVLVFRLWALQILSGTQYLNVAENNQLRTVRVQAPRGVILDRKDRVLVRNVQGSSVQIWPADLPEKGRYALLKRLSDEVVHVPVAEMAKEIEKRKNDPLTPVTIKRGIHRDQVFYLAEHASEFPGVTVAETPLRDYPYKSLAAQVLGYVGEASPTQIEADRELRAGDEAGQSGVESRYDRWLRGRPGTEEFRVDSLGNQRSGRVPTKAAVPGYAIRLTIDAKLQQAAERALREGIDQAIENEEWYANGGAIVALDPRDGQILAMASNPTYKPSLWVGNPDAKKLAPLLLPKPAEAANYPALNRAIMGFYPPGSTFKPVTALAAMEEHLVTDYTPIGCTPDYEAYDQIFNNWTDAFDRAMGLREALETSCDTYFYALGEKFFDLPPERGHPLQDWAARFGFGETTGVDLPGEVAGLLPTPEWRRKSFDAEIDRIWKPGYSLQLAIGQGDLSVTPLQMARFYALIANGGRLVTPHVVADAEQAGANGGPPVVKQRFTPPAPQSTDVDPNALQAVRDGLLQATQGLNGTATGVFGSFPVDIAGKTGTAEKWSSKEGRMLDQSWWCGYGPEDDADIVVCAVIENGGHGGSAAAPAALKVFEAHFRKHADLVQTAPTD